MPGLYAVIFDQGTVKVGMSHADLTKRVYCHNNAGKKWGIEVTKQLMLPIETKDVSFRELVLCGYCDKRAIRVEGYEWFRFPDKDIADKELKDIFRLISQDEFGIPQKRTSHYGMRFENEKRFDAAMVLVKSGMSAPEAAKKVGLTTQAVKTRKAYRDWEHEQDCALIPIEIITQKEK